MRPPQCRGMMQPLRGQTERGIGSAPSKAAKEPTTRPSPFGGGCALLPRALTLLGSDRRFRRRALSLCEGAGGWKSERSPAGCNLPPHASGGSPQDGQGSCERLLPDDACAGCRLLRGERRMAAHEERLDAGSYVLLGRQRSLVVGSSP